MHWQHRPRCDQASAWALLQAHYKQHFAAHVFDLRRAFAQDPRRAPDFSLQAPHVFADLSKNLIDRRARELLGQLARECGVETHRDALLAGEPVNVTENRPALHPLLRAPPNDPGVPAALHDAHAQMLRNLDNMLSFAEQVRADASITDVVHIGIGGSDLGPRLAVQALDAYVTPGAARLHFVANMDAHDLLTALRSLQPGRTLFIVASKSFGTAETLANARAALDWFHAGCQRDAARHFVALTARPGAAAQLGITRCFTLAEGVGGRYSLWSVIGLPLAIAIGAAGFRALLAGAHAMDRHFASAPVEANLPLQLALLDVWQRDFLGFASRCLVPYHHGLRQLPAWWQQLEMESNGKSVDLHGRAMPVQTAPVIWGAEGSNGQHAFFQLLHQGAQTAPVEFIAVRQAGHPLAGQHRQLLCNALAQARALMVGAEHPDPARRFPGNRPSAFLLLERLDPVSLGALLALYEHRTFAAGSLWGINSFDQWGVELGKAIARDIQAQWANPGAGDLDASTAALLARLNG
ncbi:MAG: glucose-6-phosphate isomerase [Burkholderiaceae bacterium]|nr:glucose-6-phosphate isomerase [Burkholderiaceae bacterium]